MAATPPGTAVPSQAGKRATGRGLSSRDTLSFAQTPSPGASAHVSPDSLSSCEGSWEMRCFSFFFRGKGVRHDRWARQPAVSPPLPTRTHSLIQQFGMGGLILRVRQAPRWPQTTLTGSLQTSSHFNSV